MSALLSQREMLEILNACETAVNVHEIVCRNVRAWPVLRFLLLQKLSRPDSISPKGEANRGSWRDFFRGWNAKQAVDKASRSAGQKRGGLLGFGDVFLLGMSSKETRLNEGTRFHRFFDPLVQEGREEYKFTTLRLEEESGAEPGEDTINRDLAHLMAGAERLNQTPVGERARLRLQLDEINRVVGKPVITMEKLSQELSFILVVASYFRGIFDAVQPKAAIQTCFYHQLGFGLSLACSRAGIPCAEMQHGQQGDFHPMYTHWENFPASGYDLIPSHFWMWGSESAERVRQWARPGGPHSVIVGGNPWLGWRVSRGGASGGERLWNRPVATVLVSLQFSTLPDFVWEAMNALPDVKWLLRLHPRFIADKEMFRTECQRRLGGKANWELDAASAQDFYEVLLSVDLQLTGWSTTAYEAIHFGVPTILIHPNGRDAMADYIRQGIFAYADSSADLDALIRNPKFSLPPEESYMKIGWDKCRHALQQLGVKTPLDRG